MLCPTCSWNQKLSLSERKEMALSLPFHEHSVCDSCGFYMYMSYSGIKTSSDMGIIQYYVQREDEQGLFQLNILPHEKEKYLL